MLRENSNNVLVQRLARSAGLLATIQNGNGFDGGRQRRDERGSIEGAIEPNLEDADLLSLFGEKLDGFFCGFGAGAHDDDDALGIGCAEVVEEVISTASFSRDTVHDGLDDAGNSGVERGACFTRLEEDVRILGRAAQDRTIGTERVLAKLDDVLVVEQGTNGFVADWIDLADLVRGAEAVKEVNERDAGF